MGRAEEHGVKELEVLSAAWPRVLLGEGALGRLRTELVALNVGRALVVATPRRRADAERVANLLGDLCVGVFLGAAEHVPAEIAKTARVHTQSVRADAIVAYGGGTSIGLAKAIAAKTDVAIAAIPTTYSGSEVTEIYGVTDEGRKRTTRDPRVRPALVLYDPDLTRRLPPLVTAVSGMNAIAHCVEALWVLPPHHGSRAMALLGLPLLAEALPSVVDDSEDAAARTEALRGAYYAGRALEGGVALHHKLCHLLGGSFGLPHAETHSVLLPQVIRYNATDAPEAVRRVEEALNAPSAATGVFDLAIRLGAPIALSALAFTVEDVARAMKFAETVDFSTNPRSFDRSALLELLERARAGLRPEGA
jgi:maleylacetate reductase